MEKLLPAALGAAVGIAGVLLAQRIAGLDPEPSGDGASADIAQIQGALDAATAKTAELERENRRLKGDLAAAKRSDGEPVAATETAEGERKEPGFGEAMMKAMMEFGADDSKRKVDAQVAELAERLGLTEAQQEQVRAALLARLEKQQAAGLLMMQGEATIADMAAADEDNFAGVDAEMANILSPEQHEEYAAYAHEREEKRVERKAFEDLDGLLGVAELSDEQEDQAWDLFVELNAADKPGEVPPDLTMDDFETWVDDAIGQRIDGLRPILTAEQLEAYRGQTEAYRAMIVALVRGGTSNAE